jgi:hypothetical protein
MSIPFFFQPIELELLIDDGTRLATPVRATIVDGGTLQRGEGRFASHAGPCSRCRH